MAVAAKFRAPYVFRTDGALQVHVGQGLFQTVGSSRLPVRGVSLKRNGMNVVLISPILKTKIFHFNN